MENIDFEYIEKGEYAPRENYPWVKRENIAIIVQYKDEYLFLAWNEVNYQNSLVTGGIKKKEKKITESFFSIFAIGSSPLQITVGSTNSSNTSF